MRKILLATDTKDIIYEYYLNHYSNILSYNNLDNSLNDKKLKQLILNTIDSYLNKDYKIRFSQVISTRFNNEFRHLKIRKLSNEELFLKAKENSKYLNNLYKNYENNFVYLIKTSNKDYLDEEIMSYKNEFINNFYKIFDKSNSYISFKNTLNSSIFSLLNKLNIKTKDSKIRNMQIDAKNNNKNEIENLKKHYKNIYYLKYDDKMKISKAQYIRYISVCIDKIIDNHVKNRPISSLSNYLTPILNRNIKALYDDYSLIKYARKTDDFEDAINFYKEKFSYILDKYKYFDLRKEYDLLIENYVKNVCLSQKLKDYLITNLDIYEKVMKNDYNLQSAKNNQIEKEKLINSLSWFLQEKKKEYKLYDEKQNIDRELYYLYIKFINMYLNGSCNNRKITSYLSTRLDQALEKMEQRTFKLKLLHYVELILIDYEFVLNEYYKNNTLSYTDKGNLEEYMLNILENYILNGSYVSDNKTYFKDAIDRYNIINKSYR